MTPEDRRAKLEFIRAFFDDIDDRTGRLRQMVESGFPEEAFILGCCYIDSLAAFRTGREAASRDDFIDVIFDHSRHKPLFARISWHDLYNNGKDTGDKTSPGKPIANYEQIKEALLDHFGKNCDHDRELDKSALIELLNRSS